MEYGKGGVGAGIVFGGKDLSDSGKPFLINISLV